MTPPKQPAATEQPAGTLPAVFTGRATAVQTVLPPPPAQPAAQLLVEVPLVDVDAGGVVAASRPAGGAAAACAVGASWGAVPQVTPAQLSVHRTPAIGWHS